MPNRNHFRAVGAMIMGNLGKVFLLFYVELLFRVTGMQYLNLVINIT